MDDSGGDDMDPGVYGDQLRLLGLLIDDEVGSGDFSGAAQLPCGGVGPREGIRVVLRPCLQMPTLVGGYVHFRFHGSFRLRPPVACYSECHCLALFRGNFPPLSLSLPRSLAPVEYTLHTHIFICKKVWVSHNGGVVCVCVMSIVVEQLRMKFGAEYACGCEGGIVFFFPIMGSGIVGSCNFTTFTQV